MQILLSGGKGCVAGAYERAACTSHSSVEAGELFVMGHHDVVVRNVDQSLFLSVIFGVVVGESAAFEDEKTRLPGGHKRPGLLLHPTGIVRCGNLFGRADLC